MAPGSPSPSLEAGQRKHYIVNHDQELMKTIVHNDTKHERDCAQSLQTSIFSRQGCTYPMVVPQSTVQELLSLVTSVDPVNEANSKGSLNLLNQIF